MLPTLTDVHADRPLTNYALKWLQDQTQFGWAKVFHTTGVKHASDTYYTYNREDFWRDQGDGAMLTAPGAPVKRGGYRMSTDSYRCDVRSWGKAVPRDISRNADDVIKSEQDAVDYIMQQLFVRLENQFITEMFTTSIWNADTTPTNLWSDFAASDPVGDVEARRLVMQGNTGLDPDTLVVGAAVHSKLKQHPMIKALFQVTNRDSITEEMLAKVFEVDRYIVLKAVEATAYENASSQTFAHIAGKHALLCRAGSPGSSPEQTPAAGRIFGWDGYGNPNGVAIQAPYYEDQTRSDVYEGFSAIDFKVTSTVLGEFFSGAVA